MTLTNEQPEIVKEHFISARQEMAKVMVGQTDLIRNLFICLLCGGHALIEGVPGLGKTLVVKTLSRVLNLKYSRIQFTPDLMPADILGTNIVNEDEKGGRYFEFYRGPIFGQVILADEINRASPKTQSAMLEAMQEERVTVFGSEYRLEPPFIVLATQNPLEMEGTYPLPEAQIDRFFFKLKVPYPTPAQLNEILDKTTGDYQAELQAVLNAGQILDMKRIVKQVPIASHVRDYAVRIILATHPDHELASEKVRQFVRYGASPRAVQALVMAGKALALLNGRYNVAFEDLRELSKPVLRHRVILNLRGEAEGMEVDDIVEEILAKQNESLRA